MENPETLHSPREEILESIAQLWDDASREQNPVLRANLEKIAKEIQDTRRLSDEELLWVMTRTQVLRGLRKEYSGE